MIEKMLLGSILTNIEVAYNLTLSDRDREIPQNGFEKVTTAFQANPTNK